MSYEVWGTPPDPEPGHCPMCGEQFHSAGCEVCELDRRRVDAELEAGRLRFALQAAHAAQPAKQEGWKLVPAEPTQEMQCRGMAMAFETSGRADWIKHVFAEMLAAAPPAARSIQAGEPEQPRLTVRLTSFPESNGKRNWTALLVRTEKFDGLVGTCGGISLARGELWNRVAYEAERARYLIGERVTEPYILDYGDDIHTPEEWVGEVHESRRTAINSKERTS